MERQVIHRDRQELNQNDLNNAQTWTDEAQQHLITDAVTSEKQYVGLTVTSRSATEVDVAPGRLYTGNTGEVFALTQTQTVSLFAMLPLQDSKWLSLSIYGLSEDTDIQPRDFLIDLETGQTQPEAVPMERRRVAQIHIAQGLESPTPEKPEPPTGYTLIAHVRLNPSGIQEVVLATALKLPNLQRLNAQVQQHQGWIERAEPRIAHIQSDIAGLGEAVAARATIQQAIQLGMDMARVKERMEIPDDYKFYGADHFLTDDESDVGHGDYDARNDEGIRPAIVASDTVSLALLNPVEPEATVSATGFLLPKYTEVTRLRMETRKGELTINQYQYQTQNVVQRTMSRQRLQYGETRSYCTNSHFWNNGVYDATTGIFRQNTGETWTVDPADRVRAVQNHQFLRVTQFWQTTYNETYWDTVTVPHTVQGSILGQTILMAQTGFLSSLELYFTNVDAAGGLTLLLVDASRGQPDMSKAIAKMDLAANALNTGWCKITMPTPVFVESGKRYAVVLVSGAQHRIGYTEGTEYTQGVLLYAQDGAYFNEASDRDLMLRMNFCRFNTPRAIIQCQPLQLAGGIADIDMLHQAVVPDGCEMTFEYQVGGLWHPIADRTAENLATLPALLPLRIVFIGTTDLQPMIRLTDSQVVVSRQGTSFTHVSTVRTLATSSTEVRVRLLLEDYDATYHTANCQLLIGAGTESADSTTIEIVDLRSRWIEYKFLIPATTSYKMKITGSTTDWRKPFHVAERYDIAL